MRRGDRIMRSLRILGIHVASRIRTIISSTPKLSQLHLYHISKPSSSFSYLLVGKDSTAIAAALSLAETSKSCSLGLQVHPRIIKLGLTNDTFSLNNLIKMYSKFGHLGDAIKVFDEMPERNLVSWTLIVTTAVQDGEYEMGLEVYSELVIAGLRPNEFTVASVLKGCALCASMEAYRFGISVHCCALKIGIQQSRFVVGSLLNMYAKLGDVESAKGLFKSMSNLDTACWNTMIGGYAQCGYGFESLRLVSLMVCEGISMDHFTFVNAFKGCSSVGNLDLGTQLHGLLIRSDMEFSTSVMNALMDMYSTHGKKDLAFKVFNRIKAKDIISWNTAFGVFYDNINAKDLPNLVHEFMLANMKPNHVTFSALFRQCGQLLDLNLGLQFYCLALQYGICNEGIVRNSLVNMFSRCGAIEMAFLFFDSLPHKSITSWNELISGCNSNYYYREAMMCFCNLWHLGVEANEFTFSFILETLFRHEHQQLVRQIHGAIVKSGFLFHGYICSSLVKCYVKLRQLDDSFEFFNGCEKLDVETWGTMISVLVHQEYHFQAFKFLYSMMEAGRKPDEFILGSILNSCADIAGYHLTSSVQSLVIKMGFQTQVFVVSAVIDAYAKCGDIGSARVVFCQSSRSGDVVIFNAMIIACAHHGLVEEAMTIFENMKLANRKPSQATFVSVLAACSHMGQVDQGRLLFKSIASDHKMEEICPDIYGCMVDMLSRNGFLEEARQIINVLPYTPWPAILRSLLSGCRIHGNLQLGEWAVKELVQLVPDNDAPYVLLSKAHSEAGSWEDATRIRREMIERGVSKSTGYSWIELW